MVIGMTLSSNSYDGHALESTLEEDNLFFYANPVTICVRYLSALGSFISIVEAHLAVRLRL